MSDSIKFLMRIRLSVLISSFESIFREMEKFSSYLTSLLPLRCSKNSQKVWLDKNRCQNQILDAKLCIYVLVIISLEMKNFDGHPIFFILFYPLFHPLLTSLKLSKIFWFWTCLISINKSKSLSVCLKFRLP